MLRAKESGQSIPKAWVRVEKALEIDKSLRAFASAGVPATYHTCDVSDRRGPCPCPGRNPPRRRTYRRRFARRGIDRAGRFERKNRDDVIDTLGAKVDGARNLMELTRDDPLSYFIGFGSISGRLGGTGQTDYCMASDMLCKLMSWYRTTRPDCRAVGFHWHGWDEIGMAAKPEVRTTLQKIYRAPADAGGRGLAPPGARDVRRRAQERSLDYRLGLSPAVLQGGGRGRMPQ